MKRLGVSDKDLQGSADISSLLKQGSGGMKAALEAMRFSRDLTVVAFLEKYDSIATRDRDSLTWEAIAFASEIDLTTLLGGIILSIQSYSANAVKILALSAHPQVMRSRIEFSALAGGEKDRTAIDTGLGFLPTSKGSTFIINPVGKAAKGDDDDGDEPESDLEHLFPDLKDTQEALVPIRARMIESGS